MKNLQVSFSFFVLVAILSGCAATDMRAGLNLDPANLNIPAEYKDAYKEKKADTMLKEFLIESWDSTGVKETPQLLRREVSCFKVPFPRELRKEQPTAERIKWYALVIANGYEYLGQLLKMTLSGDEAEFLVDGDIVLKNAKVLTLSTRAEKAYGLSSPDEKGVVIDRDRFMPDLIYRQELVEKYGSLLSDFQQTEGLLEVIDQWNRFDTPRGFILTPLDEKQFRGIVDINPGYTHSQRLASENIVWVFSIDPIETAVHNLIGNNLAAEASPTTGWDFNSVELPSRGEDDEKD